MRRKNRGGYESAREPKPWPKVSPGPADGMPPSQDKPHSPPPVTDGPRCVNCGKCPECGR